MNPYLGKFSVLVCDNARIHKSYRFKALCTAKGIKLEFLPPYSPDYNPVSHVLLCLFRLKPLFIMYRLTKHFIILKHSFAGTMSGHDPSLIRLTHWMPPVCKLQPSTHEQLIVILDI